MKNEVPQSQKEICLPYGKNNNFANSAKLKQKPKKYQKAAPKMFPEISKVL